MVAGKDYVDPKSLEDFIYRSYLKSVEKEFFEMEMKDKIILNEMANLDMAILNQHADLLARD